MRNCFFKTSLMLVALVIGCGSNTAQDGKPQEGGGGTETKVAKLNGAEYNVLAGALTSTDSSVSGTGTLVFKKLLLQEDNHYGLAFSLTEPDSSVVAVWHSDGQLKNGISLTFQRIAGERDVKIAVAPPLDGTDPDVTTSFSGLAVGQAVGLSFDLHRHGHFILDGNEEQVGFQQGPIGNFWGFILNKATLTKAEMGVPQHGGR